MRPELSELLAYPGRLDYVTIGKPVEERSDAAAIIVYDSAACMAETPENLVGWISAYPGDTFQVVSNPDKTVARIMVRAPDIQTERGIHAGSTLEELLDAYGSETALTQSGTSDLYSVEGADGVLVFEVATAREPAYGSRIDTVLWMLLLGPDVKPFSGLAPFGPCS